MERRCTHSARSQFISKQTHPNYFIHHNLTRYGQKQSRDAASESQKLCIAPGIRGSKRAKTGNTDCPRKLYWHGRAHVIRCQSRKGGVSMVTVVVLCLSVCLPVGYYSRTTGYEATYERYQQLHCYKGMKKTWRFC